ncbi:hypothetical protein D3C84_1044400 [compost metagenome]
MSIDACLAHLARRDWLTQGPLSELTASYVEALRRAQNIRRDLGRSWHQAGCKEHLPKLAFSAARCEGCSR